MKAKALFNLLAACLILTANYICFADQVAAGSDLDKSEKKENVQKQIKEELSQIDLDAAYELTETNPEGSQLLDSLKGQPQFMAGQDVSGDAKPGEMQLDPVFTEAQLADDANAIIRMSHAGWVDQEYFESYLVRPMEKTVKFDQIWFLYLFHSRCKSKACMLLNEAYEYIFIDWLNSTRTVGIDLEKEDTPQTKYARDNVKIGRVNCKKFKREICDRVMMSDQKLPKFLILHQNTSYEYRGNLTWDALLDQLYRKEFIRIAEEGDAKKDMEGLTMKNWNHFYKYRIKRRFDMEYARMENEGTMAKLKDSLGLHLGQLKYGIMLIAKTYGVRRLVAEENIWTFCVWCMVTPFAALMIAICYEGHYLKKMKAQKEAEKLMKVKKNK